MKITLPNELVEQLRADDLKGLHIRDFVSLDILPSGEYITDVDNVDLDASYIQAVSEGLTKWFNSLKSDSDWFSKIDGDWVNIHFDDLETSF